MRKTFLMKIRVVYRNIGDDTETNYDTFYFKIKRFLPIYWTFGRFIKDYDKAMNRVASVGIKRAIRCFNKVHNSKGTNQILVSIKIIKISDYK